MTSWQPDEAAGAKGELHIGAAVRKAKQNSRCSHARMEAGHDSIVIGYLATCCGGGGAGASGGRAPGGADGGFCLLLLLKLLPRRV